MSLVDSFAEDLSTDPYYPFDKKPVLYDFPEQDLTRTAEDSVSYSNTYSPPASKQVRQFSLNLPSGHSST